MGPAMNRRTVLQILGGGAILAAAGGGWAVTRAPHAARAPWQMAGAYDDPRLRALSWAVLAPNPHNRQPWIVDLAGPDRFTLFFDTERQLPHTDPVDRQLTIGLGCFLELMRMAARADGYEAEIALFPEGEDAAGLDTRPVAHVTLTPGPAETDPLWPHVLARRSNKEPYDTARAIDPALLPPILAVGGPGVTLGGSVAGDEVGRWRALTETALMIEIETDRTYKESVDLFRIGKREVLANPDGIDFTGPMFEALKVAGQFDRAVAMDRESMGYRAGVDAVLANCRTAMGHLWMVTPGNARADQIAAGRDWLRVNLACTRAGLGFQPLSQALQEYPEMDALYRETHAALAPEGGTVQMLSRIGYGPEVVPAPRWPLEAKVRTA